MSINNGAQKFMKELIIKDTIEEYLSVSKYISWNDNNILSKADEFKLKFADEVSLIKAIYEFVRDEIKHSWDVQDKRVTKSATEVLEQGVLQIALEATDMGRPLYESYGFVKMEDEMELV